METSHAKLATTAGKRRLLRRFARGVFRAGAWATMALTALAILGIAYETVAARADRSSFPPPGRLIDVGGYRLHFRCTGEGSPAVVLDAGLGSYSLYWRKVEAEVARFTTVCSFDRPGYGWSDAGPDPRTTETIASELHTLFTKAGIPRPLVLVGWSFGGFTARLYTYRYPGEVAGLVLVDSGHEDQFTRFVPALLAQIGPPGLRNNIVSAVAAVGGPEKAHTLVETTATRIAWLRSRLGISRWSSRHASREGFWEDYPGDTWRQARYCELQHEHVQAVLKEQEALEESESQVRAARNLGSIPLVVIARGGVANGSGQQGTVPNELDRIWRELQSDLLSLSSNSRLVIAADSDHLIPHRQPLLVAQAVRDVVQQAWDKAR